MFSHEKNNEKNHDKKQPFKKFDKQTNAPAAETNGNGARPVQQNGQWRNGAENHSGDSRKGQIVCFSCNEIGHRIKDCPKKNGGYTNNGPPVSQTNNIATWSATHAVNEGTRVLNADQNRISTTIQQLVRRMTTKW